MRRINVSVDTLNAEKFHEVTRRGDLDQVLAGIKARFPKAIVTYVEGTGLVGAPMAGTPDSVFCSE